MDASSQTNMQQTCKMPISSLHQKAMVVQLSPMCGTSPTTGRYVVLVGRVGGTDDTTFRNFNYAAQEA